MYSVKDDLTAGFPHSDIRGSKLTRSSPRLFAACHVLHRLLAPRHPPNALLILDLLAHRQTPIHQNNRPRINISLKSKMQTLVPGNTHAPNTTKHQPESQSSIIFDNQASPSHHLFTMSKNNHSPTQSPFKP